MLITFDLLQVQWIKFYFIFSFQHSIWISLFLTFHFLLAFKKSKKIDVCNFDLFVCCQNDFKDVNLKGGFRVKHDWDREREIETKYKIINIKQKRILFVGCKIFQNKSLNVIKKEILSLEHFIFWNDFFKSWILFSL